MTCSTGRTPMYGCPMTANFEATNQAAQKVEQIIRQQAELWGKQHPDKDGKPSHILRYVTTWVGGGSPRFWFSLSPQPQQLNYAEVLVELTDKDDHAAVRRPSATCPVGNSAGSTDRLAATADQSGELSGGDSRHEPSRCEHAPAARRTSGPCGRLLRRLRRSCARRRRPSGCATSGTRKARTVTSECRPGPRQPGGNHQPRRRQLGNQRHERRARNVSARRRPEHSGRGAAEDGRAGKAVRHPEPVRVRRTELDARFRWCKFPAFKTAWRRTESSAWTTSGRMSLYAFPAPGHLPSEITKIAVPKLLELEKTLPPGYGMSIGGEFDKQKVGFRNLGVVLVISIAMIYLALLFQFNNAIKPLLVFAAAPYGVAGALIALWVMNTSFGFMAFLGIASLIGVIVSHVIVLFDFIEEMHAKGEPFEEAVIDAGIIRLRPVMITVGATVLALFPLAMHGGPLWQPLVLCPDRRTDGGDVHYAADGSGAVFDLGAGFEMADVGRETERDEATVGGAGQPVTEGA